MNESFSDRLGRALPNLVIGVAPLALAWLMRDTYPEADYLLALALGVLIAIATRVRNVMVVRRRAARGLPPPERALARWQVVVALLGLLLYFYLLPSYPALSVWHNPWLLGTALGYLIALQFGNALVNFRGGVG